MDEDIDKIFDAIFFFTMIILIYLMLNRFDGFNLRGLEIIILFGFLFYILILVLISLLKTVRGKDE